MLFNSDDGACWVAAYDGEGKIACLNVTEAKYYPYDALVVMMPELMKRVREQLEAYERPSQ